MDSQSRIKQGREKADKGGQKIKRRRRRPIASGGSSEDKKKSTQRPQQ